MIIIKFSFQIISQDKRYQDEIRTIDRKGMRQKRKKNFTIFANVIIDLTCASFYFLLCFGGSI